MKDLIQSLNEITNFKVKEETLFKIAHLMEYEKHNNKVKCDLIEETMTMGELFEFNDHLSVGEKDINGVFIETPSGLSEIETLVKKPKEEMVTVKTEITEVKVATEHKFTMLDGTDIFAKDVTEIVVNGKKESVISKVFSEPEDLFDISIPYPHLYYTENRILHHNSALLMSAASTVYLAKKDVLFISLEMTDMEIGRRVDANLLNYPANDLGKMNRNEFETKLQKVAELSGNLVIKDYPAGTFNTLTLKALLSELKSKDGFVPEMICIDYIGLMSSTRVNLGTAGGYAFYKSIAEELHGFAKKEDVVIFTAAQLNRCIAKGTFIGDIKIEDISPGDEIEGNGMKVKVITKKPSGMLKGYRVKLKSGKEIIVSSNHRFPTENGLISIDTGLVSGMKLSSQERL